MFDTTDYTKQILTGIDSKLIAFLEKRAKRDIPTLIQFENTKGLTYEMIKQLPNNPNIQIRILGGLHKDKYESDHYYERNTFSVYELTHILQAIEKLESRINPKWDQLEKAKYLYSKLANHITYDHNPNREGRFCSSLRSLVTGKAVCAGYALIYKELMDRQGITCDYVRGHFNGIKHAWNIITIDKEEYAIDVTNEAALQHTKIDALENYECFGFSERFINCYKPDSDERVQDYSQYRNNTKYIAKSVKYPDFKICKREDGTQFLIKQVNSEKDSNNLYEYMYCDLNHDGSLGETSLIRSENNLEELMNQKTKLWYFINALLAKERLERYSKYTNGYIGYIENDYAKVYDSNYENLKVETKKFTRSDNSQVILKKVPSPLESKGIYRYITYEFANIKGTIDVSINNVYSEMDISILYPKKFEEITVDYLLDYDRLKNKAKYNAGYIGSTQYYYGRVSKVNNAYSQTIVEEEAERLSARR